MDRLRNTDYKSILIFTCVSQRKEMVVRDWIRNIDENLTNFCQ